MPVKEFKCISCGHKFEEVLGIKDPNPDKCPKCGAGELKQLLSTFRIAGVRTKSAAPSARPAEEAAGPPEFGGGPGDEGMGMGEDFDEGAMGEDFSDEDGFGDEAGGEEPAGNEPDDEQGLEEDKE